MCREYSWFQTPCEDSLEFSCKWSSIVPPTTPTGPPQGDCPDGWLDIMVGTVYIAYSHLLHPLAHPRGTAQTAGWISW